VTEINTHNLICEFGKHKGERWTRIPVSYLKWVANEKGHNCGAIARAELARRGSVTPTIEVSGHAIDRASLNCRHLWHATRGDEEGLHAWLCRLAQEALLKGEKINDEKYEWAGMLLVYEVGELYPVLKTVMPAKKKVKQ
jgi:hypothetical protein